MKLAVVYYSLSGNNERFARDVSQALDAPSIEIKPRKPVKNSTIFWNLVSGSAPKCAPEPRTLANCDKLLFIAPVWMGMVAFPLRPYLRAARELNKPFAFLTIDGGSEKGNPTLERDLLKRAGCEPEFMLEQQIYTLIPPDKAADYSASNPYRITDADERSLVETAIFTLKRYGFLRA